eukprot:CAMPEP_0172532990 /NCGR_PEP_ID=MMETSP1067-20121228/5845_1 /TAXON_ID=265564 ORGANISM="Thalassiosira punctigera, Strain Tpunct2005C2" /NCGR_SAMPLE_ID=MMETSP1067 /ASSEMBLY_ACC=CAM_ASM_000444 /LENGTH=46 /DNA_ID= /DNA_START= /DNA_END= /DNA_ORIENTATION=
MARWHDKDDDDDDDKTGRREGELLRPSYDISYYELALPVRGRGEGE